MTQKFITYRYLHRLLIPVLGCLLILLASLYVYFLSRSVLNVVMREEIESEIAVHNSAIGELEFEYLALKNAVDSAQAEGLGLQALTSKQYVERHSLSERALTLNQ